MKRDLKDISDMLDEDGIDPMDFVTMPVEERVKRLNRVKEIEIRPTNLTLLDIQALIAIVEESHLNLKIRIILSKPITLNYKGNVTLEFDKNER